MERKEFSKADPKKIGQGAVEATPPYSGIHMEAIKNMQALNLVKKLIDLDFENNPNCLAEKPCSGAPLDKLQEVFGKELAPMLLNAIAAKSPSPEQMFVIEQAYLNLQEHNKDAKPQTNAFADLAKNVAPQSKVDFMAKFREQHMKGM